MSEKRLSEIMSDSVNAIYDALEVLDKVTIQAIDTHFDAGVTCERERIIKLLEEQECDCHNDYCDKWADGELHSLMALIKGENE